MWTSVWGVWNLASPPPIQLFQLCVDLQNHFLHLLFHFHLLVVHLLLQGSDHHLRHVLNSILDLLHLLLILPAVFVVSQVRDPLLHLGLQHLPVSSDLAPLLVSAIATLLLLGPERGIIF